MTLDIGLGQLMGIVIGGLTLQAIGAGFAMNAFRSKAIQWHEDNQKEFVQIKRALGLLDPDDSAFPRRSEMERLITDKDKENTHIWTELGSHEVRITKLENK